MKTISLFVICALIIGCAATPKSSQSAKSTSHIVIKAMDKKVKTNLLKANYGWGKEVAILARSPKSKADSKWFVEIPVMAEKSGNYEFDVSLSDNKSNPFDVYVNESNVFSDISFQNGRLKGFAASDFVVGVVQLLKGENKIQIKNDKSGSAPHITQFSFTKISE